MPISKEEELQNQIKQGVRELKGKITTDSLKTQRDEAQKVMDQWFGQAEAESKQRYNRLLNRQDREDGGGGLENYSSWENALSKLMYSVSIVAEEEAMFSIIIPAGSFLYGLGKMAQHKFENAFIYNTDSGLLYEWFPGAFSGESNIVCDLKFTDEGVCNPHLENDSGFVPTEQQDCISDAIKAWAEYHGFAKNQDGEFKDEATQEPLNQAKFDALNQGPHSFYTMFKIALDEVKVAPAPKPPRP